MSSKLGRVRPRQRNVPHPVITPAVSRVHHSRRVLRAMTLLALGGHAVILIAAVVAGVPALAWFNVGSCLVYLLAYRLSQSGRVQLVFALGTTEVLAHSWFATAILGFSSGFHIYALGLIPLAMTFDRWPLSARISLSGILIANYLGLAVSGHLVFARHQGIVVDLLRYGNFSVGALVLAALSYYYVRAVGIAEEALLHQNRSLDSLSRTDQLTGLPNRRHALEWLTHEEARSQRYQTTAAIGIADLDHFKEINDRFGHDAGDAVLATVAGAITQAVRKQDVSTRWGGEEFLVLLPDTDLQGGIVAMEKVREAVANCSVPWDGAELQVTVTVGVSVLSKTVGIDESIRLADRALFEGKTSGRDRVVQGT